MLEPRPGPRDERHDALREGELLRCERVDGGVGRLDLGREERVLLFRGGGGGGWGGGVLELGLGGAERVADVFRGLFLDLLLDLCGVRLW